MSVTAAPAGAACEIARFSVRLSPPVNPSVPVIVTVFKACEPSSPNSIHFAPL